MGGLTPAQKLVYLCLAEHSDKNGSCWPSVPKIAAQCNLTERGVYKVLKALKKDKLLDVKSSAGKATHYLLTPELRSSHTPALYSGVNEANTPELGCTLPLNEGVIPPHPPIKRTIKEPSYSAKNDKKNKRPSKKKKQKIPLEVWEEKNGQFSINHVLDFAQKYRIPHSELRTMVDQFRASCFAKDYRYVSFAQAFQSWNLKDAKKRKAASQGNTTAQEVQELRTLGLN